MASTDSPTRKIERRGVPTGYSVAIVDKEGKLQCVFGPSAKDNISDEELVVMCVEDRTGQWKLVPAPDFDAALVQLVMVQPGYFAIVHNPAEPITDTDGLKFTNGRFAGGKKELPNLRYGETRTITRGMFPKWPYQKVEIKPIYQLSPDNYLRVRIVGKVDDKAEFYEALLCCASQNEAVIERPGNNEVPATDKKKTEPALLKEGSVVILRGSVSERFIPPSGTEVLKHKEPEDDNDKEIMDAVVLGDDEWCELILATGASQRIHGPCRVIPGPYDTFREDHVGNYVVKDYPVRDDQGLVIRITSAEVTRAELSIVLPTGAKFDEGDKFTRGTEIFVHGVNGCLSPPDFFDVLSWDANGKREPHFGNDRSNVYVDTIGVDGKSAIYVKNLATGEVQLEKGPKPVLLDPRKRVHVKRRVPKHLWNGWIGHTRPDKNTTQDYVESLWTISVPVPANEAVLVTSSTDCNVVMGPCDVLLKWDEQILELKLSRGREKNPDDKLSTFFLTVDGNTVTDEFRVTTRDNVSFKIRLSYNVRFDGNTKEERLKWFIFRNYVQFLVDTARSRQSAACRLKDMRDLFPSAEQKAAGALTEFIRDTLLGSKPTEGHRKGWHFSENNMVVYDVNVLGQPELEDREIAGKLTETNRAVVTASLESARLEAELAQKRNKARTDTEVQKLNSETERAKKEGEKALRQMEADLATLVTDLQHRLETTKAANARLVQKAQTEGEAQLNQLREEQRQRAETTKRDFDKKVALAEQQHKDELARLANESAAERENAKQAQDAEMAKLRKESEQALANLAAEHDSQLRDVTLATQAKIDTAKREAQKADAELQQTIKRNADEVEVAKKSAFAKIDTDLEKAQAEADKIRLEAAGPALEAATRIAADGALGIALAEHLPAARGTLEAILPGPTLDSLEKLFRGTGIAQALQNVAGK
jgi:hypothetical protein